MAAAECPAPERVEAWADAWTAREPLTAAPTGLSYEDALCGQRRLAARLAERDGLPVGWKVGLTSAAMQRRFGAKTPARGLILSGMLLNDGARVPADFGARPVIEADLLVSIRSDAVMRARTPEEAARHIDTLIPFIELADLAWADSERPDYGAIVVANVGIRYGVMGRPVPFKGGPDWVEALAGMAVELEDAIEPAQQGKGSDILSNPLWSLVWLADDLRRRGETLKPGDLVSLGSFTVPLQPVAGRTYRVRYDGLPGGVVPTATVHFQ